MKREGWAAAVGTEYRTTNGTRVLIGRYTVTLTGAVIEGRRADEQDTDTQDRVNAGHPAFPFSWDENGRCKSSSGTADHGSDYDLKEGIRGAKR
jgi:hypothetical protein